MQFERFTVDESDYPRRPENIPDDYYWDWEVHAWFPPGGPVEPDPEAVRAYEDAEWERKREEYRRSQEAKSLNPGDEIPATGALDVLPASRKSLRAGAKREHLPLFPDDDA